MISQFTKIRVGILALIWAGCVVLAFRVSDTQGVGSWIVGAVATIGMLFAAGRTFMGWSEAPQTVGQKIAGLSMFKRIRLWLMCLVILLLTVPSLPWIITDMKDAKLDWAVQRNLNALDRSAWDVTQILAPLYAREDAEQRIRRKLDGYLALREDLTHVVFQFDDNIIYRFSTAGSANEIAELLIELPPGEFRPENIVDINDVNRETFYGVKRLAATDDGTVVGALVFAISLEELLDETSRRAGILVLVAAALFAMAALASIWTLFLLVKYPRNDGWRA